MVWDSKQETASAHENSSPTHLLETTLLLARIFQSDHAIIGDSKANTEVAGIVSQGGQRWIRVKRRGDLGVRLGDDCIARDGLNGGAAETEAGKAWETVAMFHDEAV